MSTRWADITDEIFVTVRIDGKSTHVSMAQNSTISELNQWIEKTEGLPRSSFVLSDEGGYLKRQRVLETIAEPRELLLTKRVVDGCLGAWCFDAVEPLYLERNVGIVNSLRRGHRLNFRVHASM